MHQPTEAYYQPRPEAWGDYTWAPPDVESAPHRTGLGFTFSQAASIPSPPPGMQWATPGAGAPRCSVKIRFDPLLPMIAKVRTACLFQVPAGLRTQQLRLRPDLMARAAPAVFGAQARSRVRAGAVALVPIRSTVGPADVVFVSDPAVVAERTRPGGGWAVVDDPEEPPSPTLLRDAESLAEVAAGAEDQAAPTAEVAAAKWLPWVALGIGGIVVVVAAVYVAR